jgi:ubiquinone/menaquinone biosynthesis C-methylase UbiE
MVKKIIFKLIRLKRFIPLVGIAKTCNFYIRKFASFTHKIQYLIEWSADNPEHFDHFIDQYWQWYASRISFPWERGVFSAIAIEKNSRVLELCCGDGFNAYHFYSIHASKVLGIDFDKSAIKWAKKNFQYENLEFSSGDIRLDIPDGPFDNIIWDAGIEYFTEIEIVDLMSRIKSVLSEKGILSGCTIIKHQHEYEFHNKEDLMHFLKVYFKNVHIFTTEYPTRTNLYFYATDGQLPFRKSFNLILED